jgi:Ala-tRNA(Pro) deacylase
MATPSWIRIMLQLRGIPFEELHHPEVFTAQEVAHEEHVSGHRVAKVVVVMIDDHPFELILPASRHVNLEQVRTLFNAKRARLASEAEMEQFFPDCEVGAIPAVRHWKRVGVLMDESLKVEGDIVFQAGTHTDAIRVNFRTWFDMVEPHVVSFTEPAKLAHA